MLRRLVLVMLGLWSWTGTCLADYAQDNFVSADRLSRGAVPAGPGYFDLGDGQYSFLGQAVVHEKGAYFVEQRFYSKDRGDRVHRQELVIDGKGHIRFGPKTTATSTSDRGRILPMDMEVGSFAGYAQAVKRGETRKPPRGFASYLKDGMLVERRHGGCNPLRNSARISFAKIDAELNRSDIRNYDRALLVLSETPLAVPLDRSAKGGCPEIVNGQAEHVVKAAAFGFSLYQVENSYVLAPRGLPLAVLLDDPIRDFCATVVYRDRIGLERRLTLIYMSSEMISERKQSEPERISGDDARYQAYRKRDEENFAMLSGISPMLLQLDCAMLVRNEDE